MSMVAEVQKQLDRISGDVNAHHERTERAVTGISRNLQCLEQKVAKFENGGEGFVPPTRGTGVQTLMDSLQANSAFEELAEQAARGSKLSGLNLRAMEAISIRAFLDTGSGSSSGDIRKSQRREELWFRARGLRLLEVLPVLKISSGVFESLRVISDDEASEQVHEGDAKKDLDVTAEVTEGHVATIAAHTTASAQVLADVPRLQMTVQNLITFKLLSRLEHQIINGPGGTGKIEGLLSLSTTMLPTLADTPADAIGESLMAQVRNGFSPDVIVLHPTDWLKMQITKDGEERYLLGSPIAPIPPALWNTPVVLTPSMPQGKGITLDSSYVAIMDREQPTIAISNTHGENFVKNLVTILGELRAGLDVLDTWAVYRFDLPEVSE